LLSRSSASRSTSMARRYAVDDGPGRARPIRRWPTSTPRTARTLRRPNTLPASRAC
jgi:hypothetical protein